MYITSDNAAGGPSSILKSQVSSSAVRDQLTLFQASSESVLPSMPLTGVRPVQVVVLGMPKCGTSSLHESFLRAGLRSVHWALDAGKNLQKDKQLRLRGEDAETRLVGCLVSQAMLRGLPPFELLGEVGVN